MVSGPANFRILHTLIKEGALSTMTEVMNYISYGAKVSELAKINPIARVVMTFTNECSSPLVASGVQRISSSTSNLSTGLMPISQVQPSQQVALPTEHHPPSIQQQEGNCVMISKGDKVAAMVQLADNTTCALNHSA